MKKLLLVITVMIPSIILSQGGSGLSFYGKAGRNAYMNFGVLNKAEEAGKPYYESIGGSPFANDEYLDIQVNNYETTATGRYDAFKDNFEVIAPNKKLFYLNKYVGNTVRFIDLGVKYIVLKEDNSNNFFRIVKENSDGLMIVAKERKKLIGGKKPRSTYDSYVQPFFKEKSVEYFISFDGENVAKISKRPKKFSKLFNKNKDDVKTYIKKNKLSLRDEADLKKVFDFYEKF